MTRSDPRPGLAPCAVLSLALAAPALAGGSIPSGYTVVDLGRFDGAHTTFPEELNDANEVVGWTQGPQTLLRAFLWRPGQGIVELPPPPGYTYNRATGISSNGIVCGVAQAGLEGPPRSWRWTNGVYELLPETIHGCQYLVANGVNADGTVVGSVQVTQASCSSLGAWYYSDATGLIAIDAFSALAVNDDGIATGEAFAGAYRFHPATGVQILGTLPGDDGAEGRSINQDGDVVGRSIEALIGPDAWEAFFWSEGTGLLDISPTLHFRKSAEAVNDLDHAVGSDGSSSSPNMFPWIWSFETGRVPLTSLVDPGPGFCCVDNPRDVNGGDFVIAKARGSDQADPYGYGVLLVPTTGGAFCFGDGASAPTIACPCGNSGQPGRGCENSATTGGARLVATGTTSPDELVLHASGMLPTALAIFLQGDASNPTGAPFGDGIRCVAGTLRRLYAKNAVGGFASAPEPGEPSITERSAALGDPIAPGTSRHYQVYYRDPAESFCPPPAGATFNATNAVSVKW